MCIKIYLMQLRQSILTDRKCHSKVNQFSFHRRYGTAYLYSNGEFVDLGNSSSAS
jgi:hypothetical protein